MTLVLALVIGVLYGVGSYLVMQRNLFRVVVGLVVIGHGANLLLLLAGGEAGSAPIIVDSDSGTLSDPLPQALTLTAIVISFGVTAFLLALSFRSWELRRSDEVEDDVEDRRIARLGRQLPADPAMAVGEPGGEGG
jgi:multicomponent Na+:H+ antiporter subunit C